MHFRYFLFSLYILVIGSLLAAGGEGGNAATSIEGMGPFGGDARSLLMDAENPGVIYLGTSNGRIFRSTDSGENWVPLYPGIGENGFVIDALVQHPRERNHLYAGAWDLHSDGGGLFESRDGGLHWTRVALPPPVSAVRGLSICRQRPEYMITGTLNGPYISADGGKTWKHVGGIDQQKAESVAIDPVDPRTLYVGTWRLGYKSTDFGKTWSRVDAGMPLDSDVFSISIDQKNPDVIYSSACSGVYRSANGARKWTRLRLLPDRFTIRAQVVYIDPTDSQRVYSGTTEGLYVSNNDGVHWTRLTPNSVVVNAIQVNPQNGRNIVIGTEYQGVLVSEDGGRTWKESNTGFIHRQISWIKPEAGSARRLVVGLASGTGGIYSYDFKTRTWAFSQILPGMRVLSFLTLPDNRGRLAGTAEGLYWQAGSSDPWTKLKGSIGKRTVYSLALDPKNPVIYAGTDQGTYRTSVSALDFKLPPGYRLSPQVWCITAPDASTPVIYAGSSLGLLRSWDRGTIWNAISSYGLPSRATIESVAVSPSDKNYLLAGTAVGLYESRNGGIHWRRAADGQLGMRIPAVAFLDESGQSIVAADGDSGGVFYSINGGQDWQKIAPPKTSSSTAVAKDPACAGCIYVGTRSDGVYRLQLPLN